MASIIDTLVTKLEFSFNGTPLEALSKNLNTNTVETQKLGTASVETSEKLKLAGHEAKEAGYAVEFFGEQVKAVKTILAGFLGAFLGIEAITKSIESVNELNDAMAQINAGLKSTGNAAGFTGEQFEEMADKLQDTSTYDKANILKNVTAQLLTFRNISGETFERAQQDIIDYAARSGKDLHEISIQVGRALNNPAQALGVLSRVGIQFNKEQTKMIDGMVKSGHAAEAQAYMLQYLETSFKGSAQAAADTGSGPLLQFKNNLIDLADVVGGLIEDVLNPFLNALNKTAKWIKENSTIVKSFALSLGILGLAIYGVRMATAAWAAIQAVLDILMLPFTGTVLVIVAALALLTFAIQDVWTYFKGGDSVIGRLIGWFDAFIERHQELKAILGVVGAIFKFVWAAIKFDFEVTVKAIEAGINFMIKLFTTISAYIDKFADKVTGAFGKVKSFLHLSSDQGSGEGAGTTDGSVGLLNGLAANINGAAAMIGGNASQGNSVTNNSHAPVTNVHLTVNAPSGDAQHISHAVKETLKNHYKNAARSYDSPVAS